MVVALGAAALVGSLSLGAGSAGNPGSGTWPMIISLTLIVLGLALLPAVRRTADAERKGQAGDGEAAADRAHELRVGGLHQHRERDGHHRRGQQPQRFNQPKHRVVSAHRLKAVPLLDEIDVDAEIERGDQHRGAERKDVAEKTTASIRLNPDSRVPLIPVVSGLGRDDSCNAIASETSIAITPGTSIATPR